MRSMMEALAGAITPKGGTVGPLDRWRALWRAIRMVAKAAPAAVTAQAILALLAGAAPAVVFRVIGDIVDLLQQVGATPDVGDDIARAVAVAGAFIVLNEAGQAFNVYLQFVIGERFADEAGSRLMSAVSRLPGLAAFEEPELADKMQLVASASAGPPWLVVALVDLGRQVVMALGFAVVAAGVRWWLPLAVLAAAVPAAINEWRHATRTAAVVVEGTTPLRRADYHRRLVLRVDAAKEARIFELGSWLSDRYDRFWREGTGPLFTEQRRHLGRDLAVEALSVAVAVVPFAVVFRDLAEGEATAGSFAVAVLALHGLWQLTGRLAYDIVEVRRKSQFLPDLFRILDSSVSENEPVASGTRRPPGRPERGIRFEGVDFTYPATERPVLRGLDLFLPASSSVALVGANGSGKSTVVKLLCRFYDPTAGRITLDGIDLREFDLAELRRRISAVFQDFVRYPLSAADNVGFGCVERLGDANLLAQAAEMAGAQALIDALPQRWATVLAPTFGGVDLSEGQWQRLAVARAVAAQIGSGASLLVLDEPTAALDVRLEHQLYQRFADMTRGSTTLLISHRLSTVRMAAEVALLAEGVVVEAGTHEEMVRFGGRYAEVYEMQARRFRDEGRLE